MAICIITIFSLLRSKLLIISVGIMLAMLDKSKKVSSKTPILESDQQCLAETYNIPTEIDFDQNWLRPKFISTKIGFDQN